MHSSECMFHTGVSQAHTIMSNIDSLLLLAERGLLKFLAQLNTSSLEKSVLRKIRDQLLKEEQWSYALELSTRVGLDCLGKNFVYIHLHKS